MTKKFYNQNHNNNNKNIKILNDGTLTKELELRNIGLVANTDYVKRIFTEK